MTPVILVSVKGHPGAKSRLAPLLTERERLMVAGAMFEDLVLALLPLSCQVALVTNSARAAARAGQLGWKLHWEENQISESASVDAASRQLSAQGVEAVLRLPADLPLIQPRDVEELL